jgi:hypothetical protein
MKTDPTFDTWNRRRANSSATDFPLFRATVSFDRLFYSVEWKMGGFWRTAFGYVRDCARLANARESAKVDFAFLGILELSCPRKTLEYLCFDANPPWPFLAGSWWSRYIHNFSLSRNSGRLSVYLWLSFSAIHVSASRSKEPIHIVFKRHCTPLFSQACLFYTEEPVLDWVRMHQFE